MNPTGAGERYAALTERLLSSVVSSPGHAPVELRRAVLARAAQLGTARTPARAAGAPVPPALIGYVDKVARHAYTVGDDDLAALRRAGHSDDALFEVTVAAALGAALGRLERGLAALRGAEPESSPPDPLSTSWSGGTQQKR
jgi:hypothetical protein